MNITLQQNAFQGGQPVVIDVPGDWDVEIHALPGDDMPPLTHQEILEKLNHPYGMKPLRELAQGRKECVIVFDDISRGTPTQPMAEAVLEELLGAGFDPAHIRFLCALGTHGAHTRRDFVKKLGENIVRKYRVFNHNCYENCVNIGTTKNGVKVWINSEYMACDLRIGLGALTPHPFNAFGGGGKLLFPGLASIDTVGQNHATAIGFIRQYNLINTEMMGDLSMDAMRKEVEEMTAMTGELFKVDCIYNSRLDLIDLYAGDPVLEYYAAVPAAQKYYVTQRPVEKEIVIVNANAKASEATIAVGMGLMGLAKSGGDVVIIDFTELGQVPHYLLGNFGNAATGRMYGKVPKIRPHLRRLIYVSPTPDPASAFWFGEEYKHVYVNTWQEALTLLRENYGPGTRVSVLMDGTISYYEKNRGG
jgi:nickel-dependent lactate racemase